MTETTPTTQHASTPPKTSEPDNDTTTPLNLTLRSEIHMQNQPTYLQRYERGMYEMRLNHPVIFNFTMFNMLLASFYTASRLRRRGHIFSTMATIVTFSTSAMTCFAYARSYSTKFQTEYALPVREIAVGEEIATRENSKLSQLRQKQRLLALLKERQDSELQNQVAPSDQPQQQPQQPQQQQQEIKK